MVYRVYSEKKKAFAVEAASVLRDIRDFLHIKGITDVRLLNRYDAEGIDGDLFARCVPLVFAEPSTDESLYDIPKADFVFAVEYLPGQYDQRADSAAQCIQFISKSGRPVVANARIYCLYGQITDEELGRIKKHIINPVESRETTLETKETLAVQYGVPAPIETLCGFRGLNDSELSEFLADYALAMDMPDLRFLQDYFKKIERDPTVTEIRVLDTYWSDHCRHTTFNTRITDVELEDGVLKRSFERYLAVKKELGREDKPVTLMDIATAGMRYLKKLGKLDALEESDEVNACTVKTVVEVDGKAEDWLFLFKNETHNHPTEIEPFGGAATCVGGGIRDPLSGRSYVYQAMRVTGAGDPTADIELTLPGKLPQRRITTVAAAGNSSYGNQAGLTAGHVDEIYHPGYTAKRMEIGALVGAAPAKNIVKLQPEDGDAVILLGGRTGRDGIGAATGSSKTQNLQSLESCGAEVQKGNAPDGRRLQRLFRNPDASRLIKRCNDFGAGGVSVAIGELAAGLSIDLDAVPPKYDGMDGTELAISESQERMAVVVAGKDAETFIAIAANENLEATVVAKVTKTPKLTMRWGGQTVTDIDREFLDTNGAPKYAKVRAAKYAVPGKKTVSFRGGFFGMAGELNCANKRGLAERFCSTVNSGTLLMPYGGKYQLTPAQCMAARFPSLSGQTDAASVMAYGFNPYVSEQNPYRGAYLAVVESLSKLAAAGALTEETYLSFQEFFERLRDDASRWGKPFSALLGALDAQLDFGVAAVGGKDSMSGSFEDIDVPPTLVSFAVSVTDGKKLISSEFKRAGNRVALLAPEYDETTGLPKKESQLRIWDSLQDAIDKGEIISAYAIGFGGIAESVFKMSLGNRLGFAFDGSVSENALFEHCYGGFVVELANGSEIGSALGGITGNYELSYKDEVISISELQKINDALLAGVFPIETAVNDAVPPAFTCESKARVNVHSAPVSPTAVIPVFPGTNGEYDMARAAQKSGIKTETFVIKNLSPAAVRESADALGELIGKSQILLLPGGISGGGEPGGCGKFLSVFFRDAGISDGVGRLLDERGGLIFGVGDGFHALLKLGLLPFGKITASGADSPALAPNPIGRHQSRMVDVRVVSDNSPWFANYAPGEIDTVPVSSDEGRFAAGESLLKTLASGGQIAAQYVDAAGKPTMLPAFNPFGSEAAVEGLFALDGRIFGRMGHCERKAKGLFKNVEIKSEKSIFDGAFAYFK